MLSCLAYTFYKDAQAARPCEPRSRAYRSVCRLTVDCTVIDVYFDVVGKRRKHPGGRGNAGGLTHHRINYDKWYVQFYVTE